MASSVTTADTRGVATAARAGADRSRQRLAQRLFYTAMPIAMTAVILKGFAPTYYLKGVYGTPALAPLYHVHGFLFTLWMVTLMAQPALIAARRVDLHRRFGAFAGVLVAAMAITAVFVSIDMGRRGAAPPGISPLSFVAIPFATVVVFPALIGAALYWRRQPEIHKRLMLIGSLELVPAGFGRWPSLVNGGPLAFFGFTDLFVVVMVVFDLATRGRPHMATVLGGLFLVVSQVVRVVVSGTEPWLAFAAWLIG